MPNRSIGRYLAALAAVFLTSQLIQHVIKNKRSADRGASDASAEKPNAGARPTKAEDKPRHPTEEEHRSAEQAYWNRSIVATWIAVLVAAGAAIFSYRAFQESQRQANAAEASNRAWIALSTLHLQSIEIGDEFISILGNVEFINTGKSPAQHIEARLGIVPNRIFGVTATKEFCSREKEKRIEFSIDPLDIAFPEERQSREIGGGESIDKFIKDDVSTNNEFYAQFLVPLLKKKHIDPKDFEQPIEEGKKDHAVFQFIVIGCITYRSGDVVGNLKGTCFAFKVSTKSTDPKDVGFYFGAKARIEGKTLLVEKAQTGAYAD